MVNASRQRTPEGRGSSDVFQLRSLAGGAFNEMSDRSIPPEEPAWRRLLLLEDDFGEEDDEPRFVELTLQGSTLYVRSGRGDEEGRVEIKTLRSEAAARKGLETRIATLKKKGYDFDDPVRRPLPGQSSREANVASQAAKQVEVAQRLTRFEDDCLRFFAAWQAEGFDPLRSFQAEGQRLRTDWNALARRCVTLAAKSFGVFYSERTIVDEEHGRAGPIGARQLAGFYRDPATVADLAELKILGELRHDDGAFPAAGDRPVHNERVQRALARWAASMGS